MTNNKLNIPKKNYLIYKKIYHYLNETLFIKNSLSPVSSFYKRLHHFHNNKEPMIKKKNEIRKNILLNDREKKTKIDILREKVRKCEKCFLCLKRKNFVNFGSNENKNIMIISDQASFYDQIQGFCFSDKNGILLKKILKALNIKYEDCYITTAIKCASTTELPYDLRDVEVCKNYLEEEIKYSKIKFIIAFGQITYRFLFPTKEEDSFNTIRGKILSYRKTPIVFTHHPKEMRINPLLKKEAWLDLKKIPSFLKN